MGWGNTKGSWIARILTWCTECRWSCHSLGELEETQAGRWRLSARNGEREVPTEMLWRAAGSRHAGVAAGVAAECGVRRANGKGFTAARGLSRRLRRAGRREKRESRTKPSGGFMKDVMVGRSVPRRQQGR